MRRTLDTTGRRGGGFGRARAVAAGALAAAVLACSWGCESATQSNLSEYEKLVARRRTESQLRAQSAERPAEARDGAAAKAAAAQRAADEKAAAARAAAEKAASEKAARAAAEKAASEKAAAKAAAQRAAEAEARAAAEREAREAAERAAAEAEARARSEREAREAAERAAAEREAKAAAERAEIEAKKTSEAAVEVVPPAATEWTAPAAGGDSRSADAAAGVYRLAKGDIVQIALRGIPESQLIDDSLDEFGMISLPFINEVKAEGLTASELEQRIRNQYRDDQIYPNVTVQVQVPTRYYFMQGEIRGPGRVQLVTATRLSQAIAASGGGTEFWNGKVLLRRNGEIFRKIKNARKLEKSPEDDVLLEPGDIVELMRSIF